MEKPPNMLFFSPVRIYCHLGQIISLLHSYLELIKIKITLWKSTSSLLNTWQLCLSWKTRADIRARVQICQRLQGWKKKKKSHLSPVTQGPRSADMEICEFGLLLLLLMHLCWKWTLFWRFGVEKSRPRARQLCLLFIVLFVFKPLPAFVL